MRSGATIMMTSRIRGVESLDVQRTRAALVEAQVNTAVALMAMPLDEAVNTAKVVLVACDNDLPDRALQLIPAAPRARLRAAMKMLDAYPEALLGDREIEFIAKLVEMALRTPWPITGESVSTP